VVAIITDSTQRKYVITNLGGLFRTRQDQQEWEHLTGMSTDTLDMVTSLILKPNGYLYAGTTKGIQRSTDDGVSWVKLNLDSNSYISTLAIDSSGNIFAGFAGGLVIRSSDEGENWSPFGTGFPPYIITSLTVLQSHLFAGTDYGVYRIALNETSWTWASNGLSGSYIQAMETTPSGTLLVGLDFGLYYSINQGEEWHPLGLGGLSINGIAATSDLIVVTSYSAGVFRSIDSGTTWSDVDFEYPYPQSISITPPGSLLVGTTFHGLVESDSGVGWTQIGPPAVNVFRVVRGVEGDIWAGSDRGRIFRSTNHGNTWTTVVDSLHPGNIIAAILPLSSDTICAGGYAFGVYRSTDAGVSWVSSNSGLTDDDVEDLAVDSAGNILAGTRGGLFKSTDRSQTWVPLLPDEFINTVVVTSSGAIIVGTSWHGAFRLIDVDSTWQQINNGLTSLSVISLALDDSGVMYAGTSTAGIFRTTNFGDSWEYTGLDSSYVQDLEINSNGDIFVALPPRGVYRSRNSGVTWDRIVGGLSDSYCNDVAIDRDGYIYAGTRIAGVFRSIMSTTEVVGESTPRIFSLEQNYPNPFNPGTTISFHLGERGFVTLKVFDLLGREVSTIFEGDLLPGYYQRIFRGNGLASGVYIYRLTTQKHVEIKRMLLLW